MTEDGEAPIEAKQANEVSNLSTANTEPILRSKSEKRGPNRAQRIFDKLFRKGKGGETQYSDLPAESTTTAPNPDQSNGQNPLPTEETEEVNQQVFVGFEIGELKPMGVEGIPSLSELPTETQDRITTAIEDSKPLIATVNEEMEKTYGLLSAHLNGVSENGQKVDPYAFSTQLSALRNSMTKLEKHKFDNSKSDSGHRIFDVHLSRLWITQETLATEKKLKDWVSAQRDEINKRISSSTMGDQEQEHLKEIVGDRMKLNRFLAQDSSSDHVRLAESIIKANERLNDDKDTFVGVHATSVDSLIRILKSTKLASTGAQMTELGYDERDIEERRADAVRPKTAQDESNQVVFDMNTWQRKYGAKVALAFNSKSLLSGRRFSEDDGYHFFSKDGKPLTIDLRDEPFVIICTEEGKEELAKLLKQDGEGDTESLPGMDGSDLDSWVDAHLVTHKINMDDPLYVRLHQKLDDEEVGKINEKIKAQLSYKDPGKLELKPSGVTNTGINGKTLELYEVD